MRINKNLEGKDLTISIEGRLDTNTAPELEKELECLNEIENLIFDFQKLEYISSAGLRLILFSQKTMNDKGSMVIKNANDDIKRVFEITGFLDILTIQ